MRTPELYDTLSSNLFCMFTNLLIFLLLTNHSRMKEMLKFDTLLEIKK